MSYLIPADYNKNIQAENLQQVISNDETIRSSSERASEAEVKSFLKQKYDVTKEFTDTQLWVPGSTYNVYDRVYLDAAAYAPATAYVIGNLALQNGSVYRCIANTTGAFAPADWALIGVRYAMFHVKPPETEFTFDGNYRVGDAVYWKNKTYTAKVATGSIPHDVLLQFRTTEAVPLKNIAPDDSVEGGNYWQFVSNSGTTELVTNSAIWEAKDNRDQQMVMYLVDITLYHLHKRIAPRNIPDLRVKAYDDAIAWLRDCATGAITPDLPLIQPLQGSRIRWGSAIKQINSY